MKLQRRLLDALAEVLTVHVIEDEYRVRGKVQNFFISAPVLAMLALEIEQQLSEGDAQDE